MASLGSIVILALLLTALVQGHLTVRLLTREGDFFMDNLLVRVHYIIVMIMWTGLAPLEFELPFPVLRGARFLMREVPL